MADIPGEQDLRAEDIDAIVKNYALEQFTGRQICSVIPTSSEKILIIKKQTQIFLR